jgi:uncharacterized membrane protein YeaQ/YmgE (transglycosylase-associated protein family)
MFHILWSIIIGFLAGLIAKEVMGVHMGFLMTTGLGIVGSVIGGLIARLFSKPKDGAMFHPAGFFLSIVGGVVALWVYLKFMVS